ncbi:dihydrolipoyl dehydrogenase [Siculibacillus lacustris]|uniref:Dihydrolipoyl dehydrogenase n=1 Tax=Siculibacillus lacustris TaxID=1549641 RepID=A0A4V2KT89_9HYPH|nr:dihydrolipoyl dehydrogenase [Siculibacillus lacustris]TBW36246.1 dihydrolipoyl dehydrogenase [Siculibacillus lacustris]
MSKKRVAVIGGGPGGYVAAIRLAQLGAAVTLIEKDMLGGTCLNRGCIPTKVLLHAAELWAEIGEAATFGIAVDGRRLDWAALMRRKDATVARLTGGVGFLMKKHGVEVIAGRAAFTGPTTLEITAPDGTTSALTAEAFVVATGSEPALPPVPGFDLPGIATSTEALAFDRLPRSLVVVGGGVIGVELAFVHAAFGTQVTIVEALPGILANVDDDLVAVVRARLKALGVAVHTGVAVAGVTAQADGYAVAIAGPKPFTVVAEKVLVATGRRPATDGLGLERAGVGLDRRRIVTGRDLRTSLPHVWAIGDCTAPIMLAHLASHQGLEAAESIMGVAGAHAVAAVPGAIYTRPEIAWVGMSEKEARAKGLDVVVGRFPLAANGKSLIMNAGDGLVKVIAERKYRQILGVHVIGPRATDLIGEAGLGLTLDATLDDVAATIHAHPTIAEAIAEAALVAAGRPIHAP